jgi:hypothetical protein
MTANTLMHGYNLGVHALMLNNTQHRDLVTVVAAACYFYHRHGLWQSSIASQHLFTKQYN